MGMKVSVPVTKLASFIVTGCEMKVESSDWLDNCQGALKKLQDPDNFEGFNSDTVVTRFREVQAQLDKIVEIVDSLASNSDKLLDTYGSFCKLDVPAIRAKSAGKLKNKKTAKP